MNNNNNTRYGRIVSGTINEYNECNFIVLIDGKETYKFFSRDALRHTQKEVGRLMEGIGIKGAEAFPLSMAIPALDWKKPAVKVLMDKVNFEFKCIVSDAEYEEAIKSKLPVSEELDEEEIEPEGETYIPPLSPAVTVRYGRRYKATLTKGIKVLVDENNQPIKTKPFICTPTKKVKGCSKQLASLALAEAELSRRK